ncbi:hypothetical protein Q604_UNBC05226G0001, partial [human gut metagenome]
SLQASYAEVSQKVAELEATRAKMEAHIKNLQNTQEQLQNGIIHLREGTILFQVDQLLAQAVVYFVLTKPVHESVLASLQQPHYSAALYQ